MKRIKYLSVWIVTIYLSIFLIDILGFESKSNDSRYYRDLVIQASHKDWKLWNAPKWHGNYGMPWDEYVRDHFQGHIFAGALLTKTRINSFVALDLANSIFFILSFFLLSRLLVAQGLNKKWKNIIPIFFTILPITITYSIRSNHETHLFFWTIMLLTGSHFYYNKNVKIGALLVFIACFYGLWVKGLLAFLFLPLLFIDWIFSKRNIKKLLLLLFIASLSFAIAFIIYEYWYLKITGLPFFKQYWQQQIVDRSINAGRPDILKNIIYYINRLFIYTLPFSLFIFFYFIKSLKNKDCIHNIPTIFYKYMLFAITLIAPFCLQFRFSGRYIFQSYYFFVAAIFCILPDKITRFSFFRSQWSWPFIWFFLQCIHLFIFEFKAIPS